MPTRNNVYTNKKKSILVLFVIKMPVEIQILIFREINAKCLISSDLILI